MANAAKRRTVWKDAIAETGALAATTVSGEILLAESDIEGLGSGVTVTRVVGSISLSYAAGVANVVSGMLWVAPVYSGATTPSLSIDTFERNRTMWTFQRVIDLADDTTLIMVDVRTQRKLGSGVALELILDNKAANALTYSYHLRSLVLLP